MTTHQTHEGGPRGQTDSAHKLARLKMPKDLSQKSVLDIGCNEGFFCDQAARRGAREVLGVDISDRFLEEAKRRYNSPSISFRKCGWHQLPVEMFDLILWTSAMHYELDPKRILKEIALRLNPGGLFILEGGVVQAPGKMMRYVVRYDSGLWYPTIDFLECALNDAGLSYRLVTHAELVGNDPIPRVVYHCSMRVPSVVLIQGSSYSGKSGLAARLYNSCTKVISLDYFVSWIATSKWHHTPLEIWIRDHATHDDLFQLYNSIDGVGLTDSYIDLLSKAVADSDELVVIEGYMTELQKDRLITVLGARARVWVAARGA